MMFRHPTQLLHVPAFAGILSLIVTCANAANDNCIQLQKLLLKPNPKLETMQWLLDNGPTNMLLRTDGDGLSCLVQCMTRDTGIKALKLLLLTAAEKGQLQELLSITFPDGTNIFHNVDEVHSAAMLEAILEAVLSSEPERQSISQAVDSGVSNIFPPAIRDLIMGFLPIYPAWLTDLLNQQCDSSGNTPLLNVVMHNSNMDALSIVRLLIGAGANPDIRGNKCTGFRETAAVSGVTALEQAQLLERFTEEFNFVQHTNFGSPKLVDYLKTVTAKTSDDLMEQYVAFMSN